MVSAEFLGERNYSPDLIDLKSLRMIPPPDIDEAVRDEISMGRALPKITSNCQGESTKRTAVIGAETGRGFLH